MKNITIVATASAAIIKVDKLFTMLKKAGFNVKVLATENAIKYYPEIEKLIDKKMNEYLKENTDHIHLTMETDLFIVAPASANTIAKFVAGIADSMPLSTLLAARNKILFAPAMNDFMLSAIKDRGLLDWLQENKHYIIGPNFGPLKEGYDGWGRMSEPEEIVEVVKNLLDEKLSEKKILVSYGASKVNIDPIRYITNNSSGKFGKLIIQELKMLGFNVEGLDVSKHTNEEIYQIAKQYDWYVAAGALADFKFNFTNSKIKKSQNLILTGERQLDVISELSKNTDINIFAFKADDIKANAVAKMEKLNLNAIMWNKLSTMNSNLVSGELITKDETIDMNELSKSEAAKIIAQFIKKTY